MIIFGLVVKGEAVGRKIGFPTANLKLKRQLKIRRGVYAALIKLGKETYLGLAYFGRRHIFGEKQDSFEVFIFNFNRQIYGEKLSVKLIKFLRPPQAVKNLQHLKTLLAADQRRLDGQVILVNSHDQITGIEDKIKAHAGKARRHRAISVQLFNRSGELLIQQRSGYKRLFPFYWANTVCTDVRPYESYETAAIRRLQEEMGLTAELKPAFKISYAAQWENNFEREIDQVFLGLVKSKPKPDKKEINDWRFTKINKLPANLAPWFKLILKKLKPSDIVKP